MIRRATGAIEKPEYWSLRNVSDEGSCLSKANLTISAHLLLTRVSVHSGGINSIFPPLGQAGPR